MCSNKAAVHQDHARAVDTTLLYHGYKPGYVPDSAGGCLLLDDYPVRPVRLPIVNNRCGVYGALFGMCIFLCAE